jgi:uncharacterized membrane protein
MWCRRDRSDRKDWTNLRSGSSTSLKKLNFVTIIGFSLMSNELPTPPKKRPVTGWQRTVVITLDRIFYGLSRHWLAVFNSVAAVYVGLPILAPALMAAGYTTPGQLIYTAYSPMCHQMASRSFFLFGEQPAYPRAMSGSDLQPIEAYMDEIAEFQNVSPDNWLAFTIAARNFVGNERMGYKMALCERDIAIYGFVLVGGIFYGLLRRRYRIRPLPFLAFVFIGMGPIGLDGFSQLFGYWFSPIDGSAPAGALAGVAQLFPLRESTPFLRTLTGAWFGLCLVWLAYPQIDGGMSDTRRELESKLRRAGAVRD